MTSMAIGTIPFGQDGKDDLPHLFHRGPLRRRRWSYRRIARELGIHRETVARYVRLDREGVILAHAPPGSGLSESGISKPANAPPGSGGSKPANPPAGSSGRISNCEPYRGLILEKLAQGLSGVRIHQDLTAEHGARISYDSVKRFCRRLKTRTPLPFRRMECAPGEEAQVDFGTGAPVIVSPCESSPCESSVGGRKLSSGKLSSGKLPSGKARRRKTHVFRIVLSHSRKAYSEVVYRQTTDDFIRCIENAFHYFGGVPQTLVIDNLKAAVTKADWYDPELNPKIQSFCAHYDTVILPTKPYTPRHKGKVERGVDYVQENALKGRTFTSLVEQNRHLLDWETHVADTRIHGTTRKQVKKAFEAERSALSPLPVARFACFQEARRKVNRDGHVEVDKAYYSAPPEYVGRKVWARWDSRVVRIFNGRFEQIAIHIRYAEGGPGGSPKSRFSTDDRHIPSRKRSGIERGATHLLRKTELIGAHTGAWAAQMVYQRGIEGVRVLMGLLSLAKRHPADCIEQACELASTHGAYRLRTIRELIKRQGDRQERFEFIEEHPIIRSLSDYGDLVHTAFTKTST
jgi:transposase